MNILFLTLHVISSINERGIYTDLLRKFRQEGHSVSIVTPVERRLNKNTNLKQEDNVNILQVRTLNIQKTNVVEKGLGTLAIEYQYLSAIKKHLSDMKFDLVLYSTPPITFAKVVRYIKKRDNAFSYLLLKDIFPQNAVDMKMIKKGGLMHRFFEHKERKLYALSDVIGCMSPANVEFLLNHNPQINAEKVEENPNSIEPVEISYTEQEKKEIRNKYGVPTDKTVLVYGGNLGRPQGLNFLLETIQATNDERAFFLVVGDGTDYKRIKAWFDLNQPQNALLLQSLSKLDYDKLLTACDIGMIFLDKDFLIPNFPSRLLSYLEMNLPVLAATDPNTDIGDIVENNGCGFKVLAGNQDEMQSKLKRLLNSDLTAMGQKSKSLLQKHYTVDRSYKLIMNRLNNENNILN